MERHDDIDLKHFAMRIILDLRINPFLDGRNVVDIKLMMDSRVKEPTRFKFKFKFKLKNLMDKPIQVKGSSC